MKPLKIAYIGTSPITVECLEASKACPDEIQAYAVLSRSAEKGSELVKKYRLSEMFSSVESLIQNGKEVEGVYIASPNALHHRQAKTLLEAGKHLLIEKPFTVTLKQAQELSALADAKGLVLLEAVIPAHCPNFKSLVSHMPKLGKILSAQFSFGKVSSKWADFQKGERPNIFAPEMGGGSLMDIGVYGVWMMAALFGKPKSFRHEAQILSTGVDGKGVLHCTYPSFEAVVTHSKTSNEGNFFEIHGENGVLRSEYFSKMGSVHFTPKGGAIQDISVPQDLHPMVYELKNFAALVRNKAPISSYCSTKTSLIVMEILTQARRSSGIIFPEDTEEGFAL